MANKVPVQKPAKFNTLRQLTKENKMNEATLRLFNAVQVEQHIVNLYCTARTIKNGYIVVNSAPITDDLLDTIESVIGISGKKANSAFHKSWAIVRDTPIEILVIQQILHYFTTYGVEALFGEYNADCVYIPHEKLELPQITTNVSLTVIRGMTAAQILGKIIELGASGIALHQNTLDDIMTIVKYNKYNSVFVQHIKNRELKALLYDYYEIIPQEPVEFLRYLVVNLTDESLLIKNKNLIEKLQGANHRLLDRILKDAPPNLASIFYRYKPLWLAMKKASHNKTFFNRLRKQAKKMHKPLSEDYLNNVTMHLKRGDVKYEKLLAALEKVNTFRKIRLANALRFRLSNSKSILYRIRNGKGWVTDFEWHDKNSTEVVLEWVIDSIANDLHKKVNDQPFYIPEYIHYALPATEKQFVGNFPNGTHIDVPDDMIFGIYWENTDRRIDLDLAVISQNGKIGWDVSYRSVNRDVLFSGDMTDAENGASELFYIARQANAARLATVNYYNYIKDSPVPTRILVASEKPEVFGKHYLVDVNNMLAQTTIEIERQQNIVGLINDSRFYFTNVAVGNSVTSSNDERATQTREYLINSLTSTIMLRDVLERANAIVVSEPIEDCIDLSPERVIKNTFVELLS